MTSPLHNIILGVVVATVLALIMLIPNIAGVGTWKYVLAAIGLALWFLAGKRQ